MTVQGNTVQMGLTKREDDALWKRRVELIEAVDLEKVPVF